MASRPGPAWSPFRCGTNCAAQHTVAGETAYGQKDETMSAMMATCQAVSHLHAARKVLGVHRQVNDLHQPKRIRAAHSSEMRSER